MRAVVFDSFGDPEVLHIAEVPTPEARAGEVVIRVAASGVNRADLLQRAGHYPPPRGASEILGLEVSGVIRAVGAGQPIPADVIFPGIEDGVAGVAFVDACVRSSKRNAAWVALGI